MDEDSTATYKVWLGKEPTDNVTVAVGGTIAGVTVSPASLTFTTMDWNWDSWKTASAPAGVARPRSTWPSKPATAGSTMRRRPTPPPSCASNIAGSHSHDAGSPDKCQPRLVHRGAWPPASRRLRWRFAERLSVDGDALVLITVLALAFGRRPDA